MAVPAHDGDEVANFAIQHARVFPVHWHVLDELERARVGFVVFQQIGGHLQRTVDHHIQRQLLGPGGGDAVGGACLHAEDAGGVVHGAGQQSGEGEVGFMLRWIAGLAPGAELHAACAFAGDPVGIGAAQAGVLDRLMRIDRDMAFGGFGHHLLVMACHVLAFMPGVVQLAVTADHLGLSGIGHVAGLDCIDAQLLVQIETRFQLRFVVCGVTRGFVVADQAHVLRLGVGREFLDVEIGVGLGEAELLAIAEPVTIPAHVPAFHQYAVQTIFGREVDVLDHVLIGGTVLRP